MKKLSLLIVLLTSVVFTNAHVNHDRSNLNLKLWNNSSFKIILNNQDYGQQTFFKRRNLKPGIHRVKVLKYKKNRHGYGFLTKVLYNGTIRVPKNTNLTATITPQRKLAIKMTRKNHSHQQNYNNVSCSQGYGGCCNAPTQNNGWNTIMNGHTFNQLVVSLQNENFDGNKLSIAQQALQYNNLNTEQVAVLTQQFTFDSSKLEFTKMAYEKTVDKHNYFIINNEFTFSSTADDLQEYIYQYG